MLGVSSQKEGYLIESLKFWSLGWGRPWVPSDLRPHSGTLNTPLSIWKPLPQSRDATLGPKGSLPIKPVGPDFLGLKGRPGIQDLSQSPAGQRKGVGTEVLALGRPGLHYGPRKHVILSGLVLLLRENRRWG